MRIASPSLLASFMALTWLMPTAASAGDTIQLQLEITPTRYVDITEGRDARPAQGEQAKPFLLNYTIDLAPQTRSERVAGITSVSVPLHTDARTPWTDTVLPYPHYPSDTAWDLDGGSATFGIPTAYYTQFSRAQDRVTLVTSDGYDSFGLAYPQITWLWYMRTVDLPGGSSPDAPFSSVNAQTALDWFTAHQGQTFKNGYREFIVVSGGAISNYVDGDVVIKSVSAVPELNTVPMLGMGLLAMLALSRSRTNRRTARQGASI